MKIELTTLFADVCNSVAIYETLGDEAARNLICLCVETMKSIAESHQGSFIKSSGDDIMCTFPLATCAVDASCEMQNAIRQIDRNQPLVKVAIRVGFQHGHVVPEPGGDVRGDAVNVAARLADYATQSRIMTSQQTMDQANSRAAFRQLNKVRFNGKSTPVQVCEILWNRSVTFFNGATSNPDRHRDAQLIVRLGEQSCVLNESNFKVTIGRDSSSNIQVRNKNASRHHAEIQFSGNSFVLKDNSTNSTYLLQGMEETKLNRASTILIGDGLISTGLSFSKKPEEVIELIRTKSDTSGSRQPD